MTRGLVGASDQSSMAAAEADVGVAQASGAAARGDLASTI